MKTNEHLIFLVADAQLYKRLCPSVRWSVRRSWWSSWKVGKRAYPPLPTHPQLVAVYPALFFEGLKKLKTVLYSTGGTFSHCISCILRHPYVTSATIRPHTIIQIRTRPDTRQDSRGRLGRGSNAKTARNSEMWWTDGRTDRHGKV